MISIERAKILLDDPALSDKEVEEIRDGMRLLVQVLRQKWVEERASPEKATHQEEVCNCSTCTSQD